MAAYSLIVLIVLGVAVTYYDLRYRLIPDKISLAGLILGVPLYENIGWACAYGLAILIVAALTRALGGGDVKYIAVMALYLGTNTWVALLSASVVMGLLGLTLVALRKKKLTDTMAFGPFLVFGSILVALLQRM